MQVFPVPQLYREKTPCPTASSVRTEYHSRLLEKHKDPNMKLPSVMTCLELELLGLLPGEGLVAEVTVLGSTVVDGVGEVELLDNDTGTEVEVLADDLDELLGVLVGSTVVLNEEREGLGDTNGVRELDETAAGETGLDQGLGDPAGEVGSGTVDLGVILSGESTTTVGTPTTVGVDNDLTASKTGITLGTTNDEET